ncbi:MAG: BBP7 family outer membrane beta-barrel protein [Planctomycetaceae bacterium]|jgi:hypothetical protein|nr:BBP7 family outer membrane beta-barrel protein [Planctomycetaceae bacterium]
MFSLKRLLLLFALFSFQILFCGLLAAQESFRPFRPYQPEEFGGARHGDEGFTFDITGIAWTVKGFSCPIGARDATGKSMVRTVYNGNSQYTQSNTLNASSMGSGHLQFGTSYELGFNRDHSGFLFRGYSISGLGGSFESGDVGMLTSSDVIYSGKNSGVFGSMVIDDSKASTLINVESATGLSYASNRIWSTVDGGVVAANRVEYLTPLTGWIPSVAQGTSSSDSDSDSSTTADLAIWAPLPINFPYVRYSSSIDILSLELMYTYRPYPLKWGTLNLYGGLRYFDVKDSFGFTGISYGNPTEIISTGSTGTSSDDSSSSDTSDDESNDDIDITNLTTTIKARVVNQITGPQIGAKIERRAGRWTYGAEGRLLAGFNKQTSTVSGKFASQFIDAGVDVEGEGQVAPYKMIAFTNRPQAFYHRSKRDVFSPAFELRLNLRWQWTDYVGFNVGFNSTVIDNIGRGADVIDYRFNPDGSLFNIRKSNTTLTTYGVNFGVQVRR